MLKANCRRLMYSTLCYTKINVPDSGLSPVLLVGVRLLQRNTRTPAFCSPKVRPIYSSCWRRVKVYLYRLERTIVPKYIKFIFPLDLRRWYQIPTYRENHYTLSYDFVMNVCRGSRVIASVILNFGIVWRWVVDFIPLRRYPLKELRYPLYRRLRGLQGRSGRFRGDKAPSPYRDSNPGQSSP